MVLRSSPINREFLMIGLSSGEVNEFKEALKFFEKPRSRWAATDSRTRLGGIILNFADLIDRFGVAE